MSMILGHSDIQVIVFDLGDVILQLNWGKTLSTLGIEGPEAESLFRKILTSHEGVYDLFERGKIDEPQFFAQFRKDLSLKVNAAAIGKAWEYLIEGPVEGIEKVLDRIPSSYELFLFSNTSVNMYKYLGLEGSVTRYPVLNNFKKCYASFILGSRKPEQKSFESVFDDLKKSHPELRPSGVLFVDDRQDNVDGARQAGWTAERTEPSSAVSVEQVLRSYKIIT